MSLGYGPNGKRRIATVSARTKPEAKTKIRELINDQADGLPQERRTYTVAEAVESWLTYGLVNRDPSTVANRTSLAKTHLLPAIGRRRLVELTADDVESWLASKAAVLSSDSLQRLLGILRASIRRAQSRDYVKRNVALLCDAPAAGWGGCRSR